MQAENLKHKMPRKLLTSFLIIHVVLLLTQTCEDIRAFSSEIKSQRTVAALTRPIPTDSDPESEICSPFCICGCCGLSVVHHGVTMHAISVRCGDPDKAAIPIYHSPSKSPYVTSIWQPPKA